MTPCQMAVFQILPLFESYLFWGLMSPHSAYVYYIGRQRHLLVRSELVALSVLSLGTVLAIKITVSWDVAPYDLVVGWTTNVFKER
jgi:hypothetical protein